MSYLDELLLAKHVSDALGLPIIGEQIERTESVSVRLNGIERPNGFSVRVSSGLQLVFAELIWDQFAKSMLSSISRAAASDWTQVASIRTSLAQAGVQTTIEVNGADLEPAQVWDPGPVVEQFQVRAQGLAWRSTREESAGDVAIAALSLVVALLPLDTSAPRDFDSFGAEEGLQIGGFSTRYERSRANRAVAILLHGTRCKVCQLDFAERYPGIGGGYVEIHHLLPVHLMDGPAIVDPAVDLVPLCANCHRMAHRKDPPFTPDELSADLGESPPQSHS